MEEEIFRKATEQFLSFLGSRRASVAQVCGMIGLGLENYEIAHRCSFTTSGVYAAKDRAYGFLIEKLNLGFELTPRQFVIACRDIVCGRTLQLNPLEITREGLATAVFESRFRMSPLAAEVCALIALGHRNKTIAFIQGKVTIKTIEARLSAAAFKLEGAFDLTALQYSGRLFTIICYEVARGRFPRIRKLESPKPQPP